MSQPGDRPGRAPGRVKVDGLAIGAPVTAAFVGALLVDGEFAAAGPSSNDATATGSGADTAALGGVGDGLGAVPPDGAISALEAAGDANGDVRDPAALDPVSVTEPAQKAGPDAALADGGAIPPAAPSPGIEADAAAGTGAQFSLTVQGVGLAFNSAATMTTEGSGLEPLGAHSSGRAGDDVIHGTDRSDHLAGGAGDDLIYGLDGGDRLDGEAGDDQLFGGGGTDTLSGGSGGDLLDGGAEQDLLLGGAGADSLLGGVGRDRLEGGSGNDSLDGGAAADRLLGGTGDDLLIVAERGDLALERSLGPDGGGDDVLQVEDSFGDAPATFVFSDSLERAVPEGASYRQQVDPEIENLVLNGSADHDALGDGESNDLFGNAGDNALYGAAGEDHLAGGEGHDLLDGGLGADELEGGVGNDILAGADGTDHLYGDDGDDVLDGGQDADLLYGEAGNDSFVIGLQDNAVDTVFDHAGANRIVLEGVTDETVQAAIVGDDLHLIVDHNPVAVVSGYVGHEDSFAGVDAGAGTVAVDDLLAGYGDPRGSETPDPVLGAAAGGSDDMLASYMAGPSLAGADAADHLIGTSGSDWLSGLSGDDDLAGAAGSDVLEGGAGSDLLRGGGGDDRYLFETGESGLDTIRDAEGSNVAELHGFTGARLEGVVVGQDLVVVADYAPAFKVESYVGNEASFAGVQVDDTFVPTEELFG